VKKLKAIFQPLKGRGICLRIEPENKLILSGAIGIYDFVPPFGIFDEYEPSVTIPRNNSLLKSE